MSVEEITETMQETSERVFREANTTGNLAIIKLNNVSYYPTEKVQERIGWNVYGIDVNRDGLFSSSAYQRMTARDKDGHGRFIYLSRPFEHADVGGDFWFIKQDDLYWGVLNLSRVFDKSLPEVNLSIASSNALNPHRHHIKNIGYGDPGQPVRFYTVDEDGS